MPRRDGADDRVVGQHDLAHARIGRVVGPRRRDAEVGAAVRDERADDLRVRGDELDRDIALMPLRERLATKASLAEWLAARRTTSPRCRRPAMTSSSPSAAWSSGRACW
jgi:hypothetical protein